MEQNSLEDLIKKTVKDRCVEPSQEARQRLIAALNTVEPKGKKKIWLRYAIVALIILGLFVTANNLVLKHQGIAFPEPSIVVKDSTLKKLPKKITPVKSEMELVKESHKDLESKTNTNKINQNRTPLKVKYTASSNTDKNTINTLNNTERDAKLVKNTSKGVDIKNSNIDNVTIAQFDSIEKKLPKQFLYITPERLLASVKTDSNPKLEEFQGDKSKDFIKSDALLVEMQRQLFEEDNEGIFNKVRKKLKKVKEAVAARNYKQQ